MKHDSRQRVIGPATCDVALGDFLGVLFDADDPSRDHVWKLSGCWFAEDGPAKSFSAVRAPYKLPIKSEQSIPERPCDKVEGGCCNVQ